MNFNLKNFLIADCIHGVMVWPTNDQVIGQCLSLYGEFAENENIMLSKLISEGDTAIDIGANIGTQTISLSNKVGEKGKVIAFEPQNIISQCLQTNLTLNDITNVSVHKSAISNKSGWAKMNISEYAQIGRYGEAGITKTGSKVKTIKLDEIDTQKCNLIKIDVEGHEWEVIQGGQEFLKVHKPNLYMEAKNGIEGTKKYLKWLLENGWRCYWHFAWWCRTNNYKKNTNIIFEGDGDMNITAVHNEKSQPNNLLEITDPKEEWDANKYIQFYETQGIDRIYP